jgi:poly-gamma-glutamate synthase PgsB/CapB
MRTLLPCLILFLLYLAWERVSLCRAQRRVPLRIAVTGTRGKSSVARLIASILKEDGRRVVAKTTGSQAMILLPDGSQIELDRSVTPSIMEQKQLILKAARVKADCLVAEVMSIRAENHFVESRLLLRPNLVAITNVRRDHTELMGDTETKIASVLALDICSRSTVFLPAKEDCASFRAEAQRCGAELIPVAAGSSASILQEAAGVNTIEFLDNLDLACAVAERLGIKREKILEGIRKARHDIGRLKVWTYRPPVPGRTCYLVNAFAANDPESTFQVLAKVKRMIPDASENTFGVFNLRADRLPRTLQWISVLQEGASSHFKRLYLTGDHNRAVRRRLPEALALKSGPPEQITDILCSGTMETVIIFGFGNIKGPGKLLADYWGRIGEPYA